ncbi:thaumatin-like protein 1b [Iris pallida]|uniref:Thaumatin-like protein 1b n=1 Tax=Iris pallida TaxID=29817 RepID=A0AAX6H5X7_IRIPA|nr:thaumatin-like protein 1b [Iris pallida]KAJ6838513.1 thaumatin-like protein 1b [Iris pallida]
MASLSHFVLFFLLGLDAALCSTFTITNNCDYTVWPGLLSGAGTAPLQSTGFALAKGESQSLAVPAAWSGRLWGRTLCSTDAAGRFSCATGDCGSSSVQCSGSGAAPPATLAEFTLDGSGGMDFYDVSLVDGYNLPMLVAPAPGSCASTGCVADLNPLCPSDLRVAEAGGSGRGVACRSACEAFGTAEYCCSGDHGSPSTCRPSAYSQFFKNACPRAYSYAYDDATSTFTCAAGADYAITFCPSTTTSLKSGSSNNPQAAGLPLVNQSMVYSGDQLSSSAAAATAATPSASMVAVAAVLAFVWSLLFLRQNDH